MKLNRIFFNILGLSLLMCAAQVAMAQPCPPGCPTLTPIDGGISFLIAAGAAYGVKKIHEARKKG